MHTKFVIGSGPIATQGSVPDQLPPGVARPVMRPPTASRPSGDIYQARGGSCPAFHLPRSADRRPNTGIDVRSGKLDPFDPTDGDTNVVDLGELARPGMILGGTVQELNVGDTLRFRARTNQILGMGVITVTPADGLVQRSELIDGSLDGLGDTLMYEHSFTVPQSAQAGSMIEVKTSGTFMARNDPDWAFSFNVKVAD